MKRLVDNGKIKFGIFTEAIENVNLIDARINDRLNLPKWIKNLRLKEFQAFMFGDESYFVVVALFNAKLSAFAQIRIFDKTSKAHYIYETTVLPYHLNIPNNILNSNNSFKNSDLTIDIANNLSDNKIGIKLNALGKNELPKIEADIRAYTINTDSLVVSLPFGNKKGMYAHKFISPMKGFIKINEYVHEFKEKTFFICDDHKGYYPYVMEWDWITAAFHNESGLIGLNLTKNQTTDPENLNENAIWINGQMSKLPSVEFSRTQESWTISDKQGRIDLKFIPSYPKNVRINYGPFGASNYEGPFGYLSGKIILEQDIEIIINNEFAFGEKQYLRC